MPDPTFTPEPETAIPLADEPRAHFAKAIDEARAGAQALGKQAQDRADVYKDKLTQATNEWSAVARSKGDEGKDRMVQFANEGKTQASEAISGLGKMVDDNATIVDERFGVQYGDYVRGAAKSLHGVAEQLDAKDFSQIAADARAFVRASPAIAVGMAAFGGFVLARMFKGADS